ncbi:MAG: Ig-like domain-containing protein [bacterium]|nr:Ig-like domain-containing protein [bacterium]
MPNIPDIKSPFSGKTMDIVNAVRALASVNYREHVPEMTSARDIIPVGEAIMDFPGGMNEFITTLVNRIGLVIFNQKSFTNPLAALKRGILTNGETIEELFVALAEAKDYSPETAYAEELKRTIPDVRAAFHSVNWEKYYPVTIQEVELRKAFTTMEGVQELIMKIINSMYIAMNNDEFITMKYILAKNILSGEMHVEPIATVSKENASDNMVTILGISDALEILSDRYNRAGVDTLSEKNEQYLIVNTRFSSLINVEVLAAAFHMEKAEFAGHIIKIDGFGTFKANHLEKLLGNTAGFKQFTPEELEKLNAVPAVLVDKSFFAIYDVFQMMNGTYVSKGLYWNYNLHSHKVFGVSPFANAVVFNPGTPAVSSVTVSPKTATASVGGIVALSANVISENFAPMSVDWSSSNENVVVDSHGAVKILDGATGTATITATSTFNPAKKDTATITIA